MKLERATQIIVAMLVSLQRWEDELGSIKPAPGSEAAKHHLQASIRQARMSMKQMMARTAAEGSE